MLTSSFKAYVRRIAEPFAIGLSKVGFTPNRLTVFGFILILIVAAVISQGHLLLGGILVLVVSAFDTLDGALARSTGKVTKFGAFLDSSLDRYADGVLLISLIGYYSAQSNQLGIWLTSAALIGSFMVSYTRARAEGLGLSCEVGLLARPERIIILAAGLILSQITLNQFNLLLLALAVIAIFANITAIQRMVHVYRCTTPSKLEKDKDKPIKSE